MPSDKKHAVDRAATNPINEKTGELIHLRQLAAKKEQLIDILSAQAEYQEDQIRDLTRSLNDLEVEISQIKASTSWNLTKPFRILGRLIKNRGIPSDDRDVLLFKFQGIYRRLHIPVNVKRWLRRLFYRATGWPTVSEVIAKDLAEREVSLPTPEILSIKELDIPRSILKPGNVSYTGQRAPYGSRRAAILTNMLLDWDDGRPRFGGGERYALELARLLKELGIAVTFFQPSNLGMTESNYFGFKVKTFPQSDLFSEFNHGACTYFTQQTMEYDHVYYHLPEYASGLFREDGLLTCHGIWFDHNNNPDPIFKTKEWFNHLYRAFNNPQAVTCVDTHSMSFIRSLWPELSAKLHHIPNFYDEAVFHPNGTRRDPHKITILFPRRSHINRGSRLFPEITAGIPSDVHIKWIGEGDSQDSNLIRELQAKDGRVDFQVASFDEMPAWYQSGDIVVIPSTASEGTSLSCIEALACGCAVVATNIGGLSDLIMDGYNGLLVDPKAGAIADAVNYLIDNAAERERLQANAPQSVAALERSHWQEKWARVFLEQGWIDRDTFINWEKKNSSTVLVHTDPIPERWVILTRNAIHGGVESLIREQQLILDAPVIVCGGHNFPDTCPFEYTYIDKADELTQTLRGYDVILYQWLPDWAVQTVKASGKTCLEFVHRIDTSENDKSVPDGIITHSQFLADQIQRKYNLRCRVIDHPIDTTFFTPALNKGSYIGAITSYFKTKGIDLFLEAWATIQKDFPGIKVRFYGWGEEQQNLENLARETGIEAEFLPPTNEPWKVLGDYRAFIVPSRIEGFPVSILEALAMNIPVVAADLEGMREFNQKALSRGYPAMIHICQAGDIKGLATAIAASLRMDNVLHSRDYVKRFYSPDQHVEALRTFYREIKSTKNSK
jgi:glycosyltransferase involved in cell wall biosynthesis